MENMNRNGRQGDRYNPGGFGGGSQKNFQEKSLPEGYLDGGYYRTVDGERVLKKEYIVEYPRKIARDLSEKKDVNKRSQIRKFYEYSLSIQETLRRKGGSFELVEAELKRLHPFVSYALSRGTISELFKSFLEKNLEAIQDENDLNAFIKHFEAIVAYLPKERN